MSTKRARHLIDRITGVSDPCDLDVLLFLYRHPRAMLSSERLAVYVGHELSRVATSLESLIAAGLLTRTQRPTGSARMYVLAIEGQRGGWLEALLRLASTRKGRLAVLAALTSPSSSADPARPGDTEPPRSRVRQDRRPHGRIVRELRHA